MRIRTSSAAGRCGARRHRRIRQRDGAAGARGPNSWLDRYLRNEARIRSKLGAFKQRCPTALECLSVCGLRDGIEKFGHFCIDTRLAAALRGDVANGLFFRGREALPFGTAIRSVRDLLELLLTGRVAEPAANRPMFYARLIDIKMKKDLLGEWYPFFGGPYHA
jgi:hypothetical protein